MGRSSFKRSCPVFPHVSSHLLSRTDSGSETAVTGLMMEMRNGEKNVLEFLVAMGTPLSVIMSVKTEGFGYLVVVDRREDRLT